MRIEVAREIGEAEASQRTAQLEAPHDSFEALRRRVQVERGSDPDAEDDFVVWRALRDGARSRNGLCSTPQTPSAR